MIAEQLLPAQIQHGLITREMLTDIAGREMAHMPYGL
jgi:hypothetical protein